MDQNIMDRLALRFDGATYRRVIAGKEVIIHCHHYNSRIQNTVESATEIDGRAIVTSAAEAVFGDHVRNALRADDPPDRRLRVAEALYSHLGYGMLDLGRLDTGEIVATASHFVEGWNAGFPERKTPCCSVTQGYLQGAIHAATGDLVYVRETECMVSGASQCRFEVDRDRKEPITKHEKRAIDFQPHEPEGTIHSGSIDEGKIIAALVEMPIYGNESGLIPAFDVYLANTPADFYNELCIRFVEAMAEQGHFSTARRLLVSDAETCAMNTFRGIMNSAEWEALVAPMIEEKQDNLFGIIAISNGLGWGNWHVHEHTPEKSLTMESLNGYEALGFLGMRGKARDPQCFMLTGVAAGMMELIYGTGSVAERFGTYISREKQCIGVGESSCQFEVERA